MSENLINEYRDRIGVLKELLVIDKNADINTLLSLQPKLEKKIFELAMLLDLLTSSKEEEFAENVLYSIVKIDLHPDKRKELNLEYF